MSRYIIPVVPKRAIDFSAVASGSSQTSVLADRIDVTPWRELEVILRVHNHSLASGVGTIHVTGMAQSWTQEDPGMNFVASDSFDAVLDNTTPVPALLTYPVVMSQGSPCFLPFGRLVATGLKLGAGMAMNATISVEFCVKDD